MTTQIGKAGTHVITGTAGVTSGSPNLTDSAGSFTTADVGRVVATTNVAGGTTILSVTNATTAVMSANASATSGPQTATLSPSFASITRHGTGETDRFSTALIAALTTAGSPGQAVGAAAAANEWNNAGGTGTHALLAQARMLAYGLTLQEV